MLQTREVPGWTSQFREIRLTVAAGLHDLTVSSLKDRPALFPDICAVSQALGRSLRESGLNGIVDPSVRHAGGRCVLFCPDCASEPVQSRYLHTHWDGERLDLVRKLARGQLFRVLEAAG